MLNVFAELYGAENVSDASEFRGMLKSVGSRPVRGHFAFVRHTVQIWGWNGPNDSYTTLLPVLPCFAGLRGLHTCLNTGANMETIHVVQPFDQVGRRLVPGQVLQFKTADEAARRAERLAEKHAGIVAYSMDVDEDGGDYGAPRVLFQSGDVPEL